MADRQKSTEEQQLPTPTRRKIVIVENEQPQIVGKWTVAEVQQMAQALATWAGSLTVPETEKGAE